MKVEALTKAEQARLKTLHERTMRIIGNQQLCEEADLTKQQPSDEDWMPEDLAEQKPTPHPYDDLFFRQDDEDKEEDETGEEEEDDVASMFMPQEDNESVCESVKIRNNEDTRAARLLSSLDL